MHQILITIDGPAGAGKTTVSKILANRLGYTYIDTGALYRGVAFEANAAGVKPDDDNALRELCRHLNLKFIRNETGIRLLSDEKDITEAIRTPEMSMLASAVSARQVVREYLLKLQRRLGREKGTVFEGRDMGTVVFPDADIKFFLDASLKARAFRRYKELLFQNRQSLAQVETEMRRRDANDRNRTLAPLKPAEDAVMIDATDLSPEDIAEQMLSCIREKFSL